LGFVVLTATFYPHWIIIFSFSDTKLFHFRNGFFPPKKQKWKSQNQEAKSTQLVAGFKHFLFSLTWGNDPTLINIFQMG